MIKPISLLFIISALFSSGSSNAQTLPNADFEITDSTGIYPFFADWSGDEYGSGISTSAQSGNYALSVWNWYYYARGYAMNGAPHFYLDAWKSGTPYTQKAIKLHGFYHYDTVDTYTDDDTALVAVLLKKYNSTTQSVDTVGFGQSYLFYHNPADGYAPFEVVINDIQPGINPDSIVVLIKSSTSGYCSNMSSGYCLYFTVDNLSLETPMGLTDINGNKIQPGIYPNPSSGNVTIDFSYGDLASVAITGIDGQLVYESSLNGIRKVDLSLPDLVAGMYMIRIKTADGLFYSQRLVIR